MTVICWDGTTLAADKRATNCGTAYPVTKIFRSGDTLVGVCGHFARGRQMVTWLEAGRNAETFPAENEKSEDYATLLVVHRDGKLERFESCAGSIIVESPQHAIGSGRDFALMAMHMGADARRAVELTCELSVDCGNGIDVLRFDGDAGVAA